MRKVWLVLVATIVLASCGDGPRWHRYTVTREQGGDLKGVLGTDFSPLTGGCVKFYGMVVNGAYSTAAIICGGINSVIQEDPGT